MAVVVEPNSGVRPDRHLGNFPQAFSHLAPIEAASRIILAERLALEGLGPPSSSALSRAIPLNRYEGGS
jgi:hypothetical protein